jgi:hypothetical protein
VQGLGCRVQGLGFRDLLCLGVDNAVEQKARQSHTPLCMRGAHAECGAGSARRSGQEERARRGPRARTQSALRQRSAHNTETTPRIELHRFVKVIAKSECLFLGKFLKLLRLDASQSF